MHRATPISTPPWAVDGWDLAADLRKIDQQWEALREILEDPARAGVRRPAASAWSLGQHAGHAAIAAFGVARGIERSLAEPDRDRDLPARPEAAAILRVGILPRGVVKAPPRIDPAGRSREDMLAVVAPGAAAWTSLAEHGDAIAACPGRFHHFTLGHLTGVEWVRFCAIHTAHHLTIAREIDAAVGA